MLDAGDAVVQYASTMTWKETHPVVALVTSIYHTGVELTKEAMDAVETQLQRLPSLGKWLIILESLSESLGIRLTLLCGASSMVLFAVWLTALARYRE